MSEPQSPAMRPLRGLVLALGVLLGGYGAWLLLDRVDTAGVVNAVLWLGGGVIAHDAVLTGVVLAISFGAARLLPRAARVPTTVALIVFGSLSIVAFPMLTGFGAEPDNPTLLDRPYLASWLALLAMTVVLVVVATALRVRRQGSRDTPEP